MSEIVELAFAEESLFAATTAEGVAATAVAAETAAISSEMGGALASSLKFETALALKPFGASKFVINPAVEGLGSTVTIQSLSGVSKTIATYEFSNMLLSADATLVSKILGPGFIPDIEALSILGGELNNYTTATARSLESGLSSSIELSEIVENSFEASFQSSTSTNEMISSLSYHSEIPPEIYDKISALESNVNEQLARGDTVTLDWEVPAKVRKVGNIPSGRRIPQRTMDLNPEASSSSIEQSTSSNEITESGGSSNENPTLDNGSGTSNENPTLDNGSGTSNGSIRNENAAVETQTIENQNAAVETQTDVPEAEIAKDKSWIGKTVVTVSTVAGVSAVGLTVVYSLLRRSQLSLTGCMRFSNNGRDKCRVQRYTLDNDIIDRWVDQTIPPCDTVEPLASFLSESEKKTLLTTNQKNFNHCSAACNIGYLDMGNQNQVAKEKDPLKKKIINATLNVKTGIYYKCFEPSLLDTLGITGNQLVQGAGRDIEAGVATIRNMIYIGTGLGVGVLSLFAIKMLFQEFDPPSKKQKTDE